MSATLVSIIVSAIVALATVVLAWYLNNRSEVARYREREEQRRASVRKLVQLEFDQNLKTLGVFWTSVNAPPDPIVRPDSDLGFAQDEREFLKRQRLVELPLAPWNHLMWQSQASFLADAIRDVDKLKLAYELNTKLDTFLVLRESIRADLYSESGREVNKKFNDWIQRKRNLARMNQYISTSPQDNISDKFQDFNQRTLAQWNECVVIVSEVQAHGNPLGLDTRRTVEASNPQPSFAYWRTMLHHLALPKKRRTERGAENDHAAVGIQVPHCVQPPLASQASGVKGDGASFIN